MIVAQEKRKKNIAEYILYMWQIEDTIRALKFDMNLIEEKLVSQFKQPPHVLDEIRNWYTNLILAMHEENIKSSGHLKIISGLTDELYELHKRLVHETKDPQYNSEYGWALPNIQEFRKKLKMAQANEIEICFYALYGLLLLRLKKKEISEETKQAMQTFSNLLSRLSIYFHQVENGEAEF